MIKDTWYRLRFYAKSFYSRKRQKWKTGPAGIVPEIARDWKCSMRKEAVSAFCAKLEREYAEHLAAEPVLEPRRTMLFQDDDGRRTCNFLTARRARRHIDTTYSWAVKRGVTTFVVDYVTPFGLLALETLLSLRKSGEHFQLFVFRSCYISLRKSYRIIPETNLEVALLTSEADYDYGYLEASEADAKLTSRAGTVCIPRGVWIMGEHISENLKNAWLI